MTIKGTKCTVAVSGGRFTDEELQAYYKRAVEMYRELPAHIDVKFDGDHVDLKYTFQTKPFERIRRITGYLVGTTDRWNDAKNAELSDRAIHGSSEA